MWMDGSPKTASWLVQETGAEICRRGQVPCVFFQGFLALFPPNPHQKPCQRVFPRRRKLNPQEADVLPRMLMYVDHRAQGLEKDVRNSQLVGLFLVHNAAEWLLV